MKIYIDSDYKCYTDDDDGRRAIETNYFNGKCSAFIEGYRFIPSGETWVREDGMVFKGEMVTPWKPYSELDAAQREYERQLLAEYESALANSIPINELETAYQEGVDSVWT